MFPATGFETNRNIPFVIHEDARLIILKLRQLGMDYFRYGTGTISDLRTFVLLNLALRKPAIPHAFINQLRRQIDDSRICNRIPLSLHRKLLAHEGRGWKARIGMVALKPESPLAMEGNRYPITMMGMRTLTQRLMEVGQEDLRFDEVEVKRHEGVKINGRICTCVEAIHPVPRKHFRYHLARIFIDDELQMPVRFEAFLWPLKKGGKPVLVEQYTYVNIKLNNGFTNKDFDPQNEKYKFVKKR